MSTDKVMNDNDKVTSTESHESHIVKEGLDAAKVTDFVKRPLSDMGGADGEHESLSLMQEFAKKMEVLAADAEQIAGQVKKETIRQAQAEKAKLLAEAKSRADELLAEVETAAAAMREKAVEEEQRARQLLAEAEETETAMRRQAQELLQVAQSKAEQLIANTPHLMEHAIRVATDRICEEFASMADDLKAEIKTSPSPQGQSAEDGFEETEEAVAVPAVSPEAEAQPQATGVEEEDRPEAEAQPEATGPEEEAHVLYQGQVVLLVTTRGTSGLELQRLQYGLSAFPEVEIASQFASVEGSRTLVLSVKRPFPLIHCLMKMPDVEEAKDARLAKGFLHPFRRKSEALASAPVIRLRLKSDSSNSRC